MEKDKRLMGAVDLGMTKAILEQVALPHFRAARTYTGLEKQTLGGHRQNLVCTMTQNKGALNPQETDPDLPMSVQKSPVEVWVSGGLLQGFVHRV